jgi:hypothetical protein
MLRNYQGFAGPFFTFASSAAFAQGQHLAYLHALTDLRAARAHLEARGGGEFATPAVFIVPANCWIGRARISLTKEDNGFAHGLQLRAFDHIDKAIHEVDGAIRFVEARC